MKDAVRVLVSFIIPVLNGERDIARCLAALRNQKFPPEAYEVLIFDNGSEDRTHQIMCDLDWKFQVVPEIGVSALRNLGAASAQGEFLAFVDSDVEIAPNWLRHGLAVFENRQIIASGCFPGIPQDATWVQRTWDIHQRGHAKGGERTSVQWLPSMNLIVRRDAFSAVGGFNEHLETAEDVDICYRLGKLGTILNNPDMEAIHWGEAPDLHTFWRKEVWRGMGNLQGVLSHGLRWDEVPSLGYPLYMMFCVVLLITGIWIDLWFRQILLFPLSLFVLGLPACSLAMNTARQAKRPLAAPRLFLLYFVYGFARAFSVIKTWTTERL